MQSLLVHYKLRDLLDTTLLHRSELALPLPKKKEERDEFFFLKELKRKENHGDCPAFLFELVQY